MLYKDEMEITKEIVVAQLQSANRYIDEDAVAESIETIFKKVRELAGRD